MADIFEKIANLKNQFELDGQTIPANISDWSKGAKEAKLYSHLLKFDGMNMFLDRLRKDILSIDDTLSNNRELSDKERNYLFGRKDEKQEIINFFISKEKFLIDLEDKVNKELEN